MWLADLTLDRHVLDVLKKTVRRVRRQSGAAGCTHDAALSERRACVVKVLYSRNERLEVGAAAMRELAKFKVLAAMRR